MRFPLIALAAIAVSACMTPERPAYPGSPADTAAPPAPSTPSAPDQSFEPQTAREAGVRLLTFDQLPGWQEADVDAAFTAFRRSCPRVTRRADPSRLAISDDWVEPCEKAGFAAGARQFFEANFTPVEVAGGEAFVTGYYEPEIEGCRQRTADCNTPIYAVPEDLIRVEQPDPENPGKTITPLGRLDSNGQYQLYWDRAAIDAGALKGRGLEIAYAKDPVELFFLQIQGSGRLRLPDGSIMRIGYNGQNGREYVGIGRRLREMNALAPGEASMQGIMRWLRANPVDGKALMLENKSYIFFKELTGDGPLGALNVPVTPEVTLATDPRFVPLGAPVFLTTSYLDGTRTRVPHGKLMVAQDTGGAIKGANRFDFFWGAGERARTIAGGMAEKGQAWILVPNAAADRMRRDMLLSSLETEPSAG